MRYKNYFVRTCVVFSLVLSGAQVFAQDLQVGTIERPPFSYKEDGKWTGFSINLWESIAIKNDFNVTYKEYEDFSQMVEDTKDKKNDVSAANISITLERERQMDFSYPIYDSGLIMMGRSAAPSKNVLFQSIFSLSFLGVFFITLSVLWFSLYLIYHRKNKKKNTNLCIALVILWFLWMIGYGNYSFIVTKLQQKQSENKILSYEDITYQRVWVTVWSTSEKFVVKKNIPHSSFRTIEQLYSALDDQSIDIVIHDRPVLEYYVKSRWDASTEVLWDVFQPEKYGILMPSDSLLKEDINRSILEMRGNGEYESIFQTYF